MAHIRSVTKLGLDAGLVLFITCILRTLTAVSNCIGCRLIDVYHGLGGHHIQINCQDKNVSMDAQRHPERYPSLLVRVLGIWLFC